ncbi:MAG: T9SS type A sorting domain-containing protein [Bacteroidetes bacterium]|nr:T9SS type A sorting domain-containing protein [Bacteroidota bacterium]
MKNILYSILLSSFLVLDISPTFAQNNFGDSRISQNQKETSISLYPMPTEGVLFITFSKAITEMPSVLVYDMIGNLVEHVIIDRENSTTFNINLTGKKAGFYFVKVQTNTESFSRRITVRP